MDTGYPSSVTYWLVALGRLLNRCESRYLHRQNRDNNGDGATQKTRHRLWLLLFLVMENRDSNSCLHKDVVSLEQNDPDVTWTNGTGVPIHV